VDAETPGGTLNGVNAAFTLVNPPNPSLSLQLYRNGLLLDQNLDYTLASNAITFQSNAVPRATDILQASYRLAASLPGVAFADAETPGGAINSINSTYTLVQAPSPAASLALYLNGLRLEAGIDYTLSGNGITFVTVVPQTGDVLQAYYRTAP